MFKNMKLTLEEDEFYKAFEEFVCINAIHRRTEVWREFQKLQTQQEHRVGNLVVEVQGEGTKFKISWQNEEPDSEVMGFRKEESFSLNKWSETENGIFFVNSYVTKGHTIESLEAGKTYYYTFFTKSWNLGSNQLPLRNAIRFALSVPSQEDIEKLETFIANSQAKSESPEQEVYQRFKAKMRNLTDFYKIRDTIIEEIENDTSLPRPTKESLIAVCRDMSIDEEERVERLS